MSVLPLPTLLIEADGVRLPEACGRGFTSLRVHQMLSQPTACELVFTGLTDGLLEAALPLGASLRVTERGVSAALFEGQVTALEYTHASDRTTSVMVRAYDALFVLRHRQTVRAHVDFDAESLARELVADLGLSVWSQNSGPMWTRWLQTGSDFELLRQVASRSGLYLTVQDGCLYLVTLQGRTRHPGETPLRLCLHDNLLDARFEFNAHPVCTNVAVHAWNPWRASDCLAQADAPQNGCSVSAPEPVAGGVGTKTLLAMPLQDHAQAQAQAQAELDRRHRQAVVFDGQALGNPGLRPGTSVQLSGVASAATGTYVIAAAQHTLNTQEGYRTHISTALPPAPVCGDGGSLMALGQVTRIDDPEHLGRLQVSLPAYAGVLSDWLQFLAPGAGPGKGLVAPPDVGDQVLLLLDAVNPAQAVVLGSLYGQGGLPAGSDLLGSEASFCFLTPGGQRLRLDDAAQTIRLENQNGSCLDIGPQAVTLHSKAPLTIDAAGQKIVMRAQFIDFERG